MNVFRLRDLLIADYADFVTSYARIRDQRGAEYVNQELSQALLHVYHCKTDPESPLPPFKWDEERRAVLRAELDAYYAKLYGLTEEELRYILDPKDVHCEDFPSQTSRVLKDKETRLYNEYRTKRLILEAWARQAKRGV